MWSACNGLKIAWRVKDAKADAFVDTTNDWPDERAKLGSAIRDEFVSRHFTVGERGSKNPIQVINELSLGDRCAVEILGSPLVIIFGQKLCVGVRQF